MFKHDTHTHTRVTALNSDECVSVPAAELTGSHFGGGGLLRKKDTGDEPKSRQELIEELILKSKQEKVEKSQMNFWFLC